MKKYMFFLFILLMVPLNIHALTYSDTATSTIVMDTSSNRILYEKNANEPRLIASITKIMTSVIAIENGNLSDEVTVGEEVLSMYGSNIYLELNEKMTLENLLYGLLLRSGNDSAIVIANYIGKTEEEFVKLMNKKAREIGMINTSFKNSHGLDEVTQNYSTAYDMALLSSYAMKKEEYRKIVNTKKWTASNDKKTYLWNNRNKLLSLYKYATGGKTGYTPKAGRTLVTTASKNNLDLTIVTLNDGNEYTTHESLYEYYFAKYNKYLIIDKENFNVEDNYFKDELYVKNSFSYPLDNNESENVKVIIKLFKNIKYKNNDKVGELKVMIDNNEIYKDYVYIKLKEKQNVFNKIINYFKKIFR